MKRFKKNIIENKVSKKSSISSVHIMFRSFYFALFSTSLALSLSLSLFLCSLFLSLVLTFSYYNAYFANVEYVVTSESHKRMRRCCFFAFLFSVIHLCLPLYPPPFLCLTLCIYISSHPFVVVVIAMSEYCNNV